MTAPHDPDPTGRWGHHRAHVGDMGGNAYPFKTTAHWDKDLLDEDEGTLTRAEYERRSEQ